VHVLVRLENVRCRGEHVVEEVGEEEGGALVLLAGEVHLVLQLHVVRLEGLVLALSTGKLLLYLL